MGSFPGPVETLGGLGVTDANGARRKFLSDVCKPAPVIELVNDCDKGVVAIDADKNIFRALFTQFVLEDII
jgi:hypothetical protein